MEMANYWKQFENTGKVEDYLSYKAMLPKEKGENFAVDERKQKSEVEEMSDRQQGAVPYAGFY